ncbi:ATP-binding protein [Thiomicrorhabdus immobilis]|uniref:ATP-binding protein n=1 Tax=Thiomicrorhabdus immobilis TaxID=2791037 RepID=UPI001F1C3FA1|nr:ATP-binding protein [Thiomicrorhabdus immobilis]
MSQPSEQQLIVIGMSQTNRTDLQNLLHNRPFVLTFCETLSQAIKTLHQSSAFHHQAIILDESILNSHDFDEFQAYRENSSVNLIPLILQANCTQSAAIQKGVELGVFFYLIPPYDVSLFETVIHAALNSEEKHSELSQHLKNFNAAHPLLQEATFQLRTIQEAQALSSVLAYMTNDQKRIGVGLFELMLNAIEHGNLGIGYELKTQLINKSELQKEIQHRHDLPENQHKKVVVRVKRTAKYFEVIISDEGNGFDYENYLDYSENRATHSHGRGIMIANRLSFDSLEYRDSGSTVVCRCSIT